MRFAILTLCVLLGTAFCRPSAPKSVIDDIVDELKANLDNLERYVKLAENLVEDTLSKSTDEVQREILTKVDDFLKQVDAKIEEVRASLDNVHETVEVLKQALILAKNVLHDLDSKIQETLQKKDLNGLVRTVLEAFDGVIQNVEKAIEELEKELEKVAAVGDVVDDVRTEIEKEINLIRNVGEEAKKRLEELLKKDLSEEEKRILKALLEVNENVQKEVDEIEKQLKDAGKEQLLAILKRARDFDKALDEKIENYLKTKDLPALVKEILQFFDEVIHQELKKIDELEKKLKA